MKDSTARCIDNEMARSLRRVESGDLPWCMQNRNRSQDEKSRVIAEECAEVVYAAGAYDANDAEEKKSALKFELIQVAATAIAWAESL